MARSVQDAGADMISCINTLSGMAVDVARRKPRLANVIGGLSGPAIKPVALRCVWQVCKAVDIPVIGLGGICSAEDVLEFILVGAHAVQIGTGQLHQPRPRLRDRQGTARRLPPAGCDQPGRAARLPEDGLTHVRSFSRAGGYRKALSRAVFLSGALRPVPALLPRPGACRDGPASPEDPTATGYGSPCKSAPWRPAWQN